MDIIIPVWSATIRTWVLLTQEEEEEEEEEEKEERPLKPNSNDQISIFYS